MHPNFNVRIRDLEDLGVDLSWYPHPARLLRPGEASPECPREDGGGEGDGESGGAVAGEGGGTGAGSRGPEEDG